MTDVQTFFFLLGIFWVTRNVIETVVLLAQLAWTLYRKPWRR